MRELILIRHARAGKRKGWRGDDRLRPLDERGRLQAEGLVAALADYEIERILSSPFIRCVQTVEPLAASAHIEIEQREELLEGAGREETLALLAELEGIGAALCTHGDVIEAILGEGMRKGEARVIRPTGLS